MKPPYEEVQECIQRISVYRRDAFALLGMAHYNSHNIILERKMVDETAKNTSSKEMVRVVERLLTGDYVASDINRLAELLVKHNRTMAQSLETVIGFELEDLMRRENAD